MKIWQLISSEGFYGAESMLVTLSRELADLGCEITVGVFEDSRSPHTEVAETAKKAGLSVRTIRCSGRFDWKSILELRDAIQEFGTNVLHTHGYKADIYGFLASIGQHLARVSTCHLWPSYPRILRLYEFLDRLVLRTFHRISSPSKIVVATLRHSLIPTSKLRFIENGVDVMAFDISLPDTARFFGQTRGPVIGFVGRLVSVKGGEILLRSARQVLRRHPNALFAFVGEGECRTSWGNLAAALGVSENIIFTGVCREMPRMYASFDLVVLPSFEEAMPMSLLEAMSARKPVVATPVGAVSELIVNGLNGYLVTPGDVDALANAILAALDTPARVRELGACAHDRVKTHFSSRAMALRYLAMYEEAVQAKGIRERTAVHQN